MHWHALSFAISTRAAMHGDDAHEIRRGPVLTVAQGTLSAHYLSRCKRDGKKAKEPKRQQGKSPRTTELCVLRVTKHAHNQSQAKNPDPQPKQGNTNLASHNQAELTSLQVMSHALLCLHNLKANGKSDQIALQCCKQRTRLNFPPLEVPQEFRLFCKH
jgi:hypothetical protein